MGNGGGREDQKLTTRIPNGHELLMVTNFLRMTKNITFPSIKKKTNLEQRKTLMRQYIDTVVTKAASEGEVVIALFLQKKATGYLFHRFH